MASEIEASGRVYRLSNEERAAIREGLDAARRGDFASEEEIAELYRLPAK
jgi:hypothetical protein